MSNKECKTYQDVANEVGLTEAISIRYVKYMSYRWKQNELTNCLCGYAFEWARRFADGREYGASDLDGQQILRKIAKEI